MCLLGLLLGEFYGPSGYGQRQVPHTLKEKTQRHKRKHSVAFRADSWYQPYFWIFWIMRCRNWQKTSCMAVWSSCWVDSAVLSFEKDLYGLTGFHDPWLLACNNAFRLTSPFVSPSDNMSAVSIQVTVLITCLSNNSRKLAMIKTRLASEGVLRSDAESVS